jgi:hypothetical protein
MTALSITQLLCAVLRKVGPVKLSNLDVEAAATGDESIEISEDFMSRETTVRMRGQK